MKFALTCALALVTAVALARGGEDCSRLPEVLPITNERIRNERFTITEDSKELSPVPENHALMQQIKDLRTQMLELKATANDTQKNDVGFLKLEERLSKVEKAQEAMQERLIRVEARSAATNDQITAVTKKKPDIGFLELEERLSKVEEVQKTTQERLARVEAWSAATTEQITEVTQNTTICVETACYMKCKMPRRYGHCIADECVCVVY